MTTTDDKLSCVIHGAAWCTCASKPYQSQPETYGGAIHMQRLAAGLSLNELAGRLSVSNVYLGELERGKRAVSALDDLALRRELPGYAAVVDGINAAIRSAESPLPPTLDQAALLLMLSAKDLQLKEQATRIEELTASNRELREQLHVGPEWSPYKAWMDAREMIKEKDARIAELENIIRDYGDALHGSVTECLTQAAEIERLKAEQVRLPPYWCQPPTCTKCGVTDRMAYKGQAGVHGREQQWMCDHCGALHPSVIGNHIVKRPPAPQDAPQDADALLDVFERAVHRDTMNGWAIAYGNSEPVRGAKEAVEKARAALKARVGPPVTAEALCVCMNVTWSIQGKEFLGGWGCKEHVRAALASLNPDGK